MLQKIYDIIALAYSVAATTFLMLLAFLLLAVALWELVPALLPINVIKLVDSIGLLIIGFAVVETAKFIVEEEVIRQRELRSPTESRRSLTKFITIIVIAASLEALVMVFKASRTDISQVVYPAGLLIAAMLALSALGTYQWLSSRIEPPSSAASEEDE